MGDGDATGVRIDLLGPLRVQIDSVDVDVGGPKVQSVLVTLAHHLGEVVPLDTLFEAVWRDDPPKSARNVIQVRVSGLRRSLGSSFDLRSSPAGYLLDPTGTSVDVSDFARLVESAEDNDDPSTAIDLIEQALTLWRGDPVARVLDIRPLDGRLAALGELRIRAQSMRLDARLRLGEHSGCCAEAESLADQHPYREHIRALHMLALYRSGRQTEALSAFRRTRDLLVEELGVDPGPELQTLHRQILEQDQGLDLRNPLRALPATQVTISNDNLRSEPNEFVDRPEIDAIVDSLHPGRVVTAVGAGGIGKTRCVAAVARRCLDDATFADGVWLVDLAPLPEGSDDVAASVAAAMELGPQPGTPFLDTIVSYLGRRRALLVLDNCEHVAVAAATFADAVTTGCPHTAMLAASRVRLGLLAESMVTLGRLPDGSARQLLAARIAESGAGPFTDDECADLCAALDNYPLAIELAAARTRVLAPREIAERLREQPQLLRTSTDAPPGNGGRRHADLSTALDWSLDRLSPRSRETMNRAAVFVSDFDLRTAEAVLSTPEASATAVVEDLGELVENHLISRDHSRARFRVLEPIRQHLRAGTSPAIQHRYADHFAHFAIDAAQGLRSPDEAMWWDRWRAEFPHVRDAVRFLTDEKDVALLDSIMAEMAVTISICAFTEPGEWAVDALRRLELDPADAPGRGGGCCRGAVRPPGPRRGVRRNSRAVGGCGRRRSLDECDRFMRQDLSRPSGSSLGRPAPRGCGGVWRHSDARARQDSPDGSGHGRLCRRVRKPVLTRLRSSVELSHAARQTLE